jgi:hypothetical protein
MSVKLYQITRHHITENFYKSSFVGNFVQFLLVLFVFFIHPLLLFVFISSLFFTSHQYAPISNPVLPRSSPVLLFLKIPSFLLQFFPSLSLVKTTGPHICFLVTYPPLLNLAGSVRCAQTPGVQTRAWISITESIYFVYPISIALCKHVCS